MSNGIFERQQAEANIRLWLTQRRLYSRAKGADGVLLLLSVPLPLALVVAGVFWPAAQEVAKAGWLALLGIGVWLIDVTFISSQRAKWRDRAARVQEAYDCEVLKLTWNEDRVGEREPDETLGQFGQNPTAAETTSARTWYVDAAQASDAALVAAPLARARVACQRQNISWEKAQRQTYLQAVKAALIILPVGGVAWALWWGWPVADLLLRLVMPLMPAIKLMAGLWNEQDDSLRRLERLAGMIRKLEAQVDAGADEATLTAGSRRLQDELFENRRRAPSLPDWFYARMSEKLQLQADAAKAELGRSSGPQAPGG